MGKRQRHGKKPTKSLEQVKAERELPQGTIAELQASVDRLHEARREQKVLRKRKKVAKRKQDMEGRVLGGWRADRDSRQRDAARLAPEDEDEGEGEDEASSDEDEPMEEAAASPKSSASPKGSPKASPSSPKQAARDLARSVVQKAVKKAIKKEKPKSLLGEPVPRKRADRVAEREDADPALQRQFLRACAKSDMAELKQLRAKGVSPACIDRKSGLSAVMIAAGKGELGAVRWLLNNKAPVTHRDKKGDTALSFAARGGFLPVLEWLLARWGKKRKADCERACIVAAQAKQLAVVQRLLDEEGVKKRVLVGMKAMLSKAELSEVGL